MKMDKSKRTTINITKNLKNELDKMKLANESYEEIIRREIGGFTGRLLNVREPIAFELKGEYGDMSIQTSKIYWSMLRDCSVGDFWSVDDAADCIHRETASVIYCDDDVVLVKFKTYNKRNGIKFFDVEVVSYNFLSEY